ncbi:MAG: leucine-rich repeat domain-containing protein [Promethearchaeota archaeon]
MIQKNQKRKNQSKFIQLPKTEQEVVLEFEKEIGDFIPENPHSGYVIRNNHITSLELKNYNISRIPDNIDHLQFLIGLHLNNNQIRNIPESIKKMKNLEHIALYNNKISTFPEYLCNLPNLKSLLLTKNSIEKIPNNIENLQKLQFLGINYNKISKIPPNLFKLQNLTKLWLGNNNLKKLPESIKKLKNLKKFDISANKFTEIPHWFTELESLEELNIADNNISMLPAEILSTFPNLIINFDGNPIRTLAGLNEKQLIDVLMRYHKHINPEKFEKFPAQLTHKGMWFLNRVFESANPNVPGFEGERVFGLFPDILAQILEYYQKTPIQLSQQYANNSESLTADEKKRLAWEASVHEREILELKLPPNDPILAKINKRLSIPLKNGLKIMK